MKKKKRIIALFVAPSVIFLLLISVYPMLFSFYASLSLGTDSGLRT